MLWLLFNNHTSALCGKTQNGWKSQRSDFQHSSHLTSAQVYILCRYWRCCTSYSSPDISCKCWNLKNTGAAGYTRRLIGSRSGDAFEIKMGAEEQDNDEEQTKGWEWKWKPGRRKAGRGGREMSRRWGWWTKQEDKRPQGRDGKRDGEGHKLKATWMKKMIVESVREDKNVDGDFKRQ